MRKQSKLGFSLITTMFLMAVISTLMAMLIHSGSQRAFTARRLTNRIKAQAYAEAGFEHALARLMENWDNRFSASSIVPNASGVAKVANVAGGSWETGLGDDTGSQEETGSTKATATYGDGSYDLALTPMGDGKYCLIQSVGNCGGQSIEVQVLVEDFLADSGSSDPGSGPVDNSAWENTLFSGGTMNLGGNGDIDGKLHANSTMKLNGNVEITPNEVHMSSSTKISVNGNVQSDGTYTAPSIRVVGNKESSATYTEAEVPKVAFPSLDLATLYNTALANGQVINGNVKKSNDINWSNIPGGVVWVNGYMKISANAQLACTVVATGYINITGNVNWDMGYTGFNHIISRDSTIKVAGNTEINGILYAPGDITLGGNARIYGSVMSGEDVDVNGNVDVINYSEAAIADIVPPTETPKETLVGIAAWQK